MFLFSLNSTKKKYENIIANYRTILYNQSCFKNETKKL